MLQKIFLNKTDTIKIILKILFITLFCVCTVLFLFAITAFVISKTDFSYNILFYAITAILAVSSAFCGFVISKQFKENGLIWGVFAGIVISLFIVVLGIIYNGFIFTSSLFTKIIITVISGAAGGIIGVNTN